MQDRLTASPCISQFNKYDDVRCDLAKDNNYIINKKEITSESQNHHFTSMYKVKIMYHLMKYPLYQLSIDDKILYTGKKCNNSIFIGKGDEVHIKKNSKNCIAKIVQEHDGVNFKISNNKIFQLIYNKPEKPNRFSFSAVFHYKNKCFTLNSKKYKKNWVLEDSKGQNVLIIKKKSFKLFEIEVFQAIDPLFILVIGLSSIIGPHEGPFGGF